MKFLRKIGDYFIRHSIRLSICLLYGVLFMLLYNTFKDSFDKRYGYYNGFFLAGATLFFYGLLCVVTNFGGLDMFSFMFNKRRVDGRKETLYEYSERKKIERKPNAFVFFDYLLIGSFFIGISMIFM